MLLGSVIVGAPHLPQLAGVGFCALFLAFRVFFDGGRDG